MAVWNLYLDSSPIIAHAAVALLSVAGSEAAVERTFSAQGLVHSDLRNRMGNDAVEAEMFIKFNQRTVEVAEQRGGGGKDDAQLLKRAERIAEMVEEWEEDEDLPSIEGVFIRPERPVSEQKEESVAVALGSAAPMVAVAEVEDEQEDSMPQQSVVRAVASPAISEDRSGSVESFIKWYVAHHKINAAMRRFTTDEGNRLCGEGQKWDPPMRDTQQVLQRKVLAYVRGPPEVIDDIDTDQL
jgi:hypothetical protein